MTEHEADCPKLLAWDVDGIYCACGWRESDADEDEDEAAE